MPVAARAAPLRPNFTPPNRPTPELLRRGDLCFRPSSELLGVVVYENRSPLLLDTMHIPEHQRAAGLLLRELYFAAGMMPHQTHDFDSWSLGTGEMGDRAAVLRRTVTECLRALSLACRGPVSDVCFSDEVAKPLLVIKGLQELARYLDCETRRRGSVLARFAEEIGHD